MKLLEYEAKQIITSAGIVVPESWLANDDLVPDIGLPAVFKSQVPTGGRGKAGGIIVVSDYADIPPTIKKLRNHPIKGYIPKTILIEELIATKRELYLSVLINRANSTIELVANIQGGIDVESNNSNSFLRITINKKTLQSIGKKLSNFYKLPNSQTELKNIGNNLYECMVKNDATLIEINPLILTTDDKLVAGDCKIELDNAASFRHPNWKFEEKLISNNFVPLNQDGNVATIANGAGLAMATVDAVADNGMYPANFLDVGGGANSESVMAAFNQIMQFKQVKAIVINIFAGITRCDEIAKAIITARKQIENLPPLFIRLSGTNVDIAKTLLAAEDIKLLPTLESCISATKTEVTNE